MYDTDAYREEQSRQGVFRASDEAKSLAQNAGWQALVQWAEAQIVMERNRLERGVPDWDEYQRTTGRLETWRAVIGRPADLIQRANEYDSTGE